MNIQKIKHFIYLVQKERTGTPIEVAMKLGVSERMIYNYVGILKNEFNMFLFSDSPVEIFFFSSK